LSNSASSGPGDQWRIHSQWFYPKVRANSAVPLKLAVRRNRVDGVRMEKKKTIVSLRFEHRKQEPLSTTMFRRRFVTYLASAFVVVGVALGIGVIGYHSLESMSWVDSFLNASMILGGMGPVSQLNTNAGKLFAGVYALFSGLVFLVVAGLMFGPLVHRLLHLFHYEAEREFDKSQ
jgi:hypothetical protein